MYTLYYAPGACSLSVHVALEWIGDAYETVRVNPGDAEYRNINPAGQVPTLDTGDGFLLMQCAAVLGFLAQTHPDAKLGAGSEPIDQAVLERWSAFFTGDVHPAFFPIFMPQRYTVADDKASLDNVRSAGHALVRTRLGLLEEHLQGRQFIVGERRSYVDAYSIPMIRWATATLPGGLLDYPAVRAHHERMLGDPGVRRAMIDEGLIEA